MLLLLAVIAADPPPVEPARAVRRAQATVRIVRPARIALGAEPDTDVEAIVRQSQVRERDGALRPALLVEFS